MPSWNALLLLSLKTTHFYAVLWLRQGGEPITIDARPSDAIALALRADCPIYVSEQVMQQRQAEYARDRRKDRPQSSCGAGSKG